MSNTWKRLISWFWPVPEGKSSSLLNPELEWRWENGKLVLNSLHANYSYGSLHKVMRRAVRSIPDGRKYRFLVLGTGGGSVLRLLEQKPGCVQEIDAVDADPEVIRLASEVFGIRENDTLHLHCADAQHFLEKTGKAAFDIIIEDVFIDLRKPAFCNSPDYFAELDRVLAPGGILFLNSLPADKTELNHWKSLLQYRFPQVKGIRVAGSNMLWMAVKP